MPVSNSLNIAPGLPVKAEKILRRLRELHYGGGFRAVLFGILRFAGYSRLLLIERDLTQTVARRTAEVPVRFSLLAPSDAAAYLSSFPVSNAGEPARRLNSGHLCFVAWYKQRMVHSAWVAVGSLFVDGLQRRVYLPADTAYVYETMTLRGYRNLHISSERITYMAQFLSRMGIRRLIALVSLHNKAASGVWRKAGYVPTGTVMTIGVLGLRKVRFKQDHPKRVSWIRRNQPLDFG